MGIEQDELLYIFDSFRRGRDAKKKEGFGLGLAAVKAIVEGHGGRVLVKSEPGKDQFSPCFCQRQGIGRKR